MEKIKLKKDSFRKSRGGSAELLNLDCAQCATNIAVYQKDGKGSLLRTYIDRFHLPEELVNELEKHDNTSDTPNLECPNCSELLGTPMVYKPEKRLAFRLVRGKVKTSIFKSEKNE
jgi:hypothetical protein